MKKRLWYIGDMRKKIIVFGLSDAVGGTENYLLSMQRLLRNKLSFSFFTEFAQNRHAKRILEEQGEIVYIPRQYNVFKFVRILFRELKQRREETDMIYINLSNYSHHRLFLFIIAWILKYQVIIHAHGARLNLAPNGFRSMTHQVTRAFGRLFTKRFTRLAVSERAGIFMFGRQSFEVLWAGIELEKFAFSEAIRLEKRKQYRCGDKFVIGFVGRMVEVKNPEFAVRAFRAYCDLAGKDNALLLMIGDGPLFDEVSALVKKLDIEEQVILVGMSNEVNKYLQAMDCVIATSFSEGMPLGLMEAQAAALPILCAEGCYPDEIKITELVHMVPLESGADEWAKQLVEQEASRPRDRSKWLLEHHTVLQSIDQEYIADRLYRYFVRKTEIK